MVRSGQFSRFSHEDLPPKYSELVGRVTKSDTQVNRQNVNVVVKVDERA